MLAWWILPSGLGRAQTIHGEMLLLDGIQSPESSLKNCQNNFPPVYTFKKFFCTIFFSELISIELDASTGLKGTKALHL